MCAPVSEVLHDHARPIDIRRAVCPGLILNDGVNCAELIAKIHGTMFFTIFVAIDILYSLYTSKSQHKNKVVNLKI